MEDNTPATEAPPQPNKAPIYKNKWFILAAILLIIIGGSYFIFQKNTPQPIATVADTPVYKEDVQKTALEQYAADAIDKDAMKIAYDILVERIILEKEAAKLKITVPNQELENKLLQTYATLEDIPESIKTSVRYDLLKDKITEKLVETRRAHTIDFYIASFAEVQDESFTEEEKAHFTKQREEGGKALPEIEQRLKAGEAPLTIAWSIYYKYTSLQDILAINGYILKSATDMLQLIPPRLYTYNEKNLGQPLFDALYTMGPSDIKRVDDPEGAGGYVIQMKGITHANVRSYEDWLQGKKKELVKTYSEV